MNWAETHDGLRIYITGILTNKTSVAWQSLEFDCRFFDGAGRLVDAGNGRGGMTVGPNDTTAFRVSIIPTVPTNSYATFRCSVSAARNAKSWL